MTFGQRGTKPDCSWIRMAVRPMPRPLKRAAVFDSGSIERASKFAGMTRTDVATSSGLAERVEILGQRLGGAIDDSLAVFGR